MFTDEELIAIAKGAAERHVGVHDYLNGAGRPDWSPRAWIIEAMRKAMDELNSPWKDAVINELVVAHIYRAEHDSDPRKAIRDAITWNCQVALDPAVSSDARALIERGRASTPAAGAEIERLRELASTCYAGLGAECNLPEAWLDALSAAASGEPFSTEGLLPFTAASPAPEERDRLLNME